MRAGVGARTRATMRVARDEKQAHREHVPTEAQFRERIEKLEMIGSRRIYLTGPL
jgi:hypothetical protein